MTERPFSVSDKAQAQTPASDGDDAQLLELLEEEVGSLMRELAEAKLSMEEARRVEEDHTNALFLQVLEAIDAFDRVFRAIHGKEEEVTRQMKIWIGNFRTVKRLLETLLDEEGVKPIGNLEGGFDPHWHTVADTVPDASRPEGSIVEETRRGFVRGKKILRKSEVVVVKNTD